MEPCVIICKMEHSTSSELQRTPQPIDQQINTYLIYGPDDQVRQWTTKEFITVFPQMVRRLLSPEGLDKYPQQARSTFYDASLTALKEFHLIRIPGALRRKELFIPATNLNYDIEKETLVSPVNQGRPKNVDYLFRIDLAGVILLGMSQDDYESAIKKFTDTYREIQEKRPRKQGSTLKQIIHMHLDTRSVSRRWVKMHGLDTTTGRNWDGTIAELLLNLPENEINIERNYPKRLPQELVNPDAPRVYSEETLIVFLDYAAQYAEDLPMSPARSRDLVDFSLNVRRMPQEFLSNKANQDALRTILNATNMVPSQPSPGHIPDARELLVNYKNPRTRKLRWYSRDVKGLMK